MIRAAAKNFAFSAVVVDPGDLRRRAGRAPRHRSGSRCPRARGSAARAFAYTARYDAAIARWFGEREELPGPARARIREGHRSPLRREPAPAAPRTTARRARACTCCPACSQHGARSCRFNNLLDLDARPAAGRRVPLPACAIVKHNNPCGAALGDDVLTAYRRAFAADPMSAFGGIIAVNRPVDARWPRPSPSSSPRSCSRPATAPRRWRSCGAKQNLRVLEDTERRRPAARAAGAQAGARRRARAGPRHRARASAGTCRS